MYLPWGFSRNAPFLLVTLYIGEFITIPLACDFGHPYLLVPYFTVGLFFHQKFALIFIWNLRTWFLFKFYKIIDVILVWYLLMINFLALFWSKIYYCDKTLVGVAYYIHRAEQKAYSTVRVDLVHKLTIYLRVFRAQQQILFLGL